MVLLIQPMDGLGNTLKNLFSSIRLANVKNIDYIVADKRLFELFILNNNKTNYTITRALATW